MNTIPFAVRTLRRQPARAALGILGVAAVGALLFDMLLLSRGLVLSMKNVLDRGGFDIRITATPSLPGTGPRIADGTKAAAAAAALPEVGDVVALRFGDGRILRGPARPPIRFTMFGAEPSRLRAWTILRGRDLTVRTDAPVGEMLVNETLARMIHIEPGSLVTLRPSCRLGQGFGEPGPAADALPPVTLRVAGIARFPFEAVNEGTAAMNRLDFAAACGEPDDVEADLLLVAAAPGHDPDQARDAIARILPGMSVATNAQLVGRLEESGFSYFRQISTVLATVTMTFGLLLITVLLTVSVNQRLGMIAALRAIGLSRRRVVGDVIAESALMVGIGGLLSLPLGLVLAQWLDRILKRMPGLPEDLHFFVFEPRALAVHAAILIATAVLAALYPVKLVSRLPIAATLRNEIVS